MRNSIFFLCELLLSLQPNITIKNEDYLKAKHQVFAILLANPNIFDNILLKPNFDLIDERNKITSDNKRQIADYIRAVLTLLDSIDIKHSLISLQLLIESKYVINDLYKKNKYSEKETVKKKIFVAVSKLFLIGTEKNVSPLLKKVYIYANKNPDIILNEIFNILNEYSLQSNDVEIIKKIFADLLDKCNTKNKIENYNEDKVEYIIKSVKQSFNSASYFSKNEIPKAVNTLLINWLNSITTTEQTNAISSIKKIKNIRQLKNTYDLLYECVNNSEFKQTQTITGIINNSINLFNDKICNSLYERNVNVLDNKNMLITILNFKSYNESLYKFLNGNSGYTSQYSKVKRIIKNSTLSTNNINMMIYLKIYGFIYRLANNNFVWYGRQEANEFLAHLKNNFSLNLSNIFLSYSKDNEISLAELAPLLALIYQYRKMMDTEYTKESEFNRLKKAIRPVLNSSFQAAQNEYATDLNEIGFSLDTIEEMNSLSEGNSEDDE